ncbi:MAG: SIS domain-containing protein [Chloroflexota bacterium]
MSAFYSEIFQQPQALREQAQFYAQSQILEGADTIVSLWLDVVGSAEHLLFVGHGPHAITAHQAAQSVTEWAKIPVQSYSIGSYRHGRIESAGPNLGVVIFAGLGAARASAWALAEELSEYGAKVLLVENGQTRGVGEAAKTSQITDEFL